MGKAHLVLQYPDLQTGKVRLLAVTKDPRALAAFREAVLEEAKLNVLACEDEVLKIEYGQELQKLERLLSLLIPINGEVDAWEE